MNDALTFSRFSYVDDEPAPRQLAGVTPGEIQAEVARLAALHPIGYDRERTNAAERLECRLATLDAAVAAVRAKAEATVAPERQPTPRVAVSIGERAAEIARLAALGSLPTHSKGRVWRAG